MKDIAEDYMQVTKKVRRGDGALITSKHLGANELSRVYSAHLCIGQAHMLLTEKRGNPETVAPTTTTTTGN